MNYETIIGLEVHAQLQSRSKMFCGCSAAYADGPPNTHVCPICLGLPGVLPVINQQAIEYTVMTALALNCTVSNYTRFDRKNYPYPDLMKGYQISQSYFPVGTAGWLEIEANGGKKKIGISNVHLEEDVAKLLHRNNAQPYSLVDVNRSGTPLMEIVCDPDLRSPEEAREYLMKLRSILRYLGVSTANMEEGSFRCDANISIRPEGSHAFMSKTEVKNMNSFRAVYRALEYEAKRQRKVVAEGGVLTQETRGWVEAQGKTISQRSKEYAHDYRYFPEPDLPPLAFTAEHLAEIKARLPELPDAKRDRFVSQYGLTMYDASLLTGTKAMADYLEACLKTGLPQGLALQERAKLAGNWLLGEFSRLLNLTSSEINDARVSPEQLCQLLDSIQKGTITMASAKTAFEEMFNTGKPAAEAIQSLGLGQISDVDEIKNVVAQVIAGNPQAISDYKAGKTQALKFLVGQVMRVTRGRASPNLAADLLKKKIEEG